MSPVTDTHPAAKVGLFCTFRLDGHLFGVDILTAKEVNTQTTFTPVPHAPPAVRGYVNLRGQVHLILDLRLLLGMEAAPLTPDSRLVIFKPATGEAFGVLVDGIGDIVQVDADQIEEWRPPEPGQTEAGHPSAPSGLLVGIGKLESELLTILDARKFLKAVERPPAG